MATADNYQATNEDFKHLNDGLPADMARLIAAGAFDDALRLIEAELDAGTRPELAACLRAERARILRTRRDFSVTREGIIAEIQKEWPEFGAAELDVLIDHGRIDWRYVDGEQRFLASCIDSLRNYPAEVPGLDCPPTDRTEQHTVIDRMRAQGFAERRIRIRLGVAAADAVEVSPQSKVRAWLPLPAGPQVADLRIIDSTPGIRVAPEDAPQRTAYWEATGERDFSMELEYTVRAPYVDLWAENPAPAAVDPRFAPAPEPCAADLAEDEPHVVFTPYLRALAQRLFRDIPEDDALGRARAAYDWVTNNVDYRFQPAYVLLDSIADSCAKSLRADCGVFALTFMALCRLGGVPARWQSGLYVAPDHVGPHDWAMFYIEGLGWLWADCSFGSSARREGNEARRRFYFGNLGPWRMPANSAFFAPLTPADDVLRDDPFDNQTGEMIVDGVGLSRYETVETREATISEP